MSSMQPLQLSTSSRHSRLKLRGGTSLSIAPLGSRAEHEEKQPWQEI